MRAWARCAALLGAGALAGATMMAAPSKASTGDLTGAVVESNSFTVYAGSYRNYGAFCPSGSVATGGGYVIDNPDYVSVLSSVPGPSNNGDTPDEWFVDFHNSDPTNDRTETVFVVCAPVEP